VSAAFSHALVALGLYGSMCFPDVIYFNNSIAPDIHELFVTNIYVFSPIPS